MTVKKISDFSKTSFWLKPSNDKTLLLKYPWCEESEYITKCEEYSESDDDIYDPSFCLFRLFFTLTSPCPEYTSSDDGEDSEEHDDVYHPADYLSKHLLKCDESLIDLADIFSVFDFCTSRAILPTSITAYITFTVCSWNLFCHDDFCWSARGRSARLRSTIYRRIAPISVYCHINSLRCICCSIGTYGIWIRWSRTDSCVTCTG